MRDTGNSYDGRRLLGRIRAPTLIVNGTRDPLVPMRITRELAEGIPGSDLVLVEGDHLFAATDPDLLLVPALSFLGAVDEKRERRARDADRRGMRERIADDPATNRLIPGRRHGSANPIIIIRHREGSP